ncbi:hypothetical protein GAYE_PCTG30G0734 [Galdieria yellowstonensis]|uniref:SAC domain-containing protein n=1 Tax=Galdieria yellowstonensis TaxID=3028027 RepID=A0AAV9I6C2_9RHOD|nr:hypothetical protein GAYE_PCTG30G0734 [Galdieria yellowstonensis]
MSSSPIRILYYPDRIVLQNIRGFLNDKNVDLSDINAIIDATNKLATNVEQPESSFLVLPFDGQPTETNKEPVGRPLGVEAAVGFLGVLHLFSGPFAIFALQVKQVGQLPGAIPIYAIVKIRFAKLFVGADSKADRELGSTQTKLLESGHVFFSVDCDLTRRLQKQYSSSDTLRDSASSFWWNYHLCKYLGDSYSNRWCLKTIYGFVETTELQFSCHEHTNNALEDWKGNQSEAFMMTLISRRSRKRAGLRYITRGIDRRGDVANFVETEQIVWKSSSERTKNCSFSSYVIIRGSVPVFWRQNKGSVKPPPELDAPLDLCRSSFRKHFQNLVSSYGSVVALSLVDQKGSEAILAATYARHFELDMDELCSELSTESGSAFYRPQLVSFDFHFHCSGTDWERGMQTLLQQVKSFATRQKFFVLHCGDEKSAVRSVQDGVFRVNCVDCLDRTNVAQSAIARHLLVPQAKSVYVAGVHWNRMKSNSSSNVGGPVRLEASSESQFNKIWSNNADILSRQYAGTGALKTDYTRSGKRSTKGLFKDGVNSVMRMYYKNFVDEERQDAMDLWLGVAVANSLFSRTLLWSRYNNVQRLSPGGDKQYVMVELREQGMVVTSPESIHYEYPRKSFLQWSKRLSTSGKARLRLWFDESLYPESLPIANPLDLHFHKGGPAARERFLRALVSWSDLSIPNYGERVRVRIFATSHEAPLSFSDWGIPDLSEDSSHRSDIEILCLIVPIPGPNSRKYGLAAVPLDMETFGYRLISAVAADRKLGPAMAVFIKGNISKGLVMEVNEHAYRSTSNPVVATQTHSGSRNPVFNGHNGGVAISLEVSGVALGFVGVHVQGPRELFDILTHLRVGRPDIDITNQFPYFYLSGIVHGDLHWSRRNERGDPIWAKMADGAQVMALSHGISLMKNSFPGMEYLENLDFHQRRLVSSTTGGIDVHPLIDEYIPGKPLPRLTKEMVVCDIWISHLAAGNLRLPPGTDPGIPLNFYVMFENDWVEDGVATKVVQRGNQPYWSEVVLIRMLLTQDVADLGDVYLFGRVMIETPFVEDIVAGYFILPQHATGNFDVPIRLGGVYAGHLLGCLQIQKTPMTDDTSMLWMDSKFPQEEEEEEEERERVDDSASRPSPHIKRTNKKKVRKWVGKVTNIFRNRHRSGSDAFHTPKSFSEEARQVTNEGPGIEQFVQEEDSPSNNNNNNDNSLLASSSSSEESSAAYSDREQLVVSSEQAQHHETASPLVDLEEDATTHSDPSNTTPAWSTSLKNLSIHEPGERSKQDNPPSVDDLLSSSM